MIGKLKVGKLYIAYRSLNETSISAELFSDAISISPFRWDNVQLSSILLNICWICFSFWVSCSCCGCFDSSARRHASSWRRQLRALCCSHGVTMQSGHAPSCLTDCTAWAHSEHCREMSSSATSVWCTPAFSQTKQTAFGPSPIVIQTAVIGVSAIPALLLDTNTECLTCSSIHSIASLLSGKTFLPAM